VLLSAGDKVGDYTVVRRLGQGGMGTVYQATGPDGRRVAVKVPFETLLDDPGTQARYEREQEISRALDHPGVQRLIETGHLEAPLGASGSARRVPYSVLEWIEGGLLREHLYEGRALHVDEAIGIAAQLCDALEYCHARGIVHRDLKPDNVFVAGDGRVTLMDFGAALLEGARKITTVSLSSALGTPDYMSPEQVEGQRGDARSDVYSLGTMLYEMLAGRPPYRGDTALAVMAQHVQSRPAPVRTHNRRVPPALEAVVDKALRRDPAERYQSMAVFKHDLTHLDQVDLSTLGRGAARPSRWGQMLKALFSAGRAK
jgi:serine/threonine-protein kinase